MGQCSSHNTEDDFPNYNSVAPFCSRKERQSYANIQRCFEVGIFFLSCLACWLHFVGAGWRWSDVAKFHVAHSIYSFMFTALKIGVSLYRSKGKLDVIWGETPVKSGFSRCSWNNFWYQSFNIPFLATVHLFFFYWREVYSPSEPTKTCRGAWKATYTFVACFFAFCTFYELSFNENDCPEDANIPSILSYALADLVFFVDASSVALLCLDATGRSAWEGLKRGMYGTAVHAAGFILLVVLYAAAQVMNGLQMVSLCHVCPRHGREGGAGLCQSYAPYYAARCAQIHSTRPDGLYPLDYGSYSVISLTCKAVAPSFIFIALMWRRHYFVVDGAQVGGPPALSLRLFTAC